MPSSKPNLKAAQVILSALRLPLDASAVSDPIVRRRDEDLALMMTRAIRAEAIGNHDDYNNQCSFIRRLLGIPE